MTVFMGMSFAPTVIREDDVDKHEDDCPCVDCIDKRLGVDGMTPLKQFTYSYCGCGECRNKCPRCGSSMWLRGDDSNLSDCMDCELIANIRTDECFDAIKESE